MLQYFFCLKLFFYILRCILQLLANAFVPTNIKATVKLQTYVAKEDLLPFLNKRQCMDTVTCKVGNQISV